MEPKLWIVPTPIGNLDDITLRALQVLREADYILAEDTRTTRHLLQHHGIEGSLHPYHLHNEHAQTSGVIARLLQGHRAALVSDAGTPGIADPGFMLVRECVAHGIAVECLPGPTAIVPALVQSGFPTDRFIFEGFLPPKKGRQKRILALAQEKRTTVLYEAPHRLVKLLTELHELLGPERQLAVARELTKVFADTVRGTAPQLLAHFAEQPPRGEIVVIVAPFDTATDHED